jgi:hypothetical protein
MVQASDLDQGLKRAGGRTMGESDTPQSDRGMEDKESKNDEQTQRKSEPGRVIRDEGQGSIWEESRVVDIDTAPADPAKEERPPDDEEDN